MLGTYTVIEQLSWSVLLTRPQLMSLRSTGKTFLEAFTEAYFGSVLLTKTE